MTARLPCPACGRMFADPAAVTQHRRATHDIPRWQPSKRGRQAPICPRCGDAAILSVGKFGTKAECCGLWSWNLKPLVDRETHASRIRAHDAFDALWKRGTVSRGEAYRHLQIAMGVSKTECHIAQMTAVQARHMVELVRSGRLLERSLLHEPERDDQSGSQAND